MNYWIGIDGGGSRVRAVIVDSDLRICARAESGSVNPAAIGLERCALGLQAIIRAVLAQTDLPPDAVTGLGLGLAGISTVPDRRPLYDALQEVLPHAQIVIGGDYEIALLGALGEAEGLLILAGTGSIAYGINAQGQSLQIGGHGYLLGDEGSGYWLGIQALRAVLRSADHYGRPTSLTRYVLAALDLNQARDILSWLYTGQASRVREVARLAPLVLAQAAVEDPAAAAIVEAAAQELALLGHTIIRELKLDSPPVALTGGLLESANPLSLRLCTLLELPSLPVPRYPPAVGAALLSMKDRKP